MEYQVIAERLENCCRDFQICLIFSRMVTGSKMRTALRNRQNKIKKKIVNYFFYFLFWNLYWTPNEFKRLLTKLRVEALIGVMTSTYTSAGCFQSRWMGEAQVNITVGMHRRLKTGSFQIRWMGGAEVDVTIGMRRRLKHCYWQVVFCIGQCPQDMAGVAKTRDEECTTKSRIRRSRGFAMGLKLYRATPRR